MSSMNPGTPPEGWDEIDPGLVEAAKGVRQTYLALIIAGFTTSEAASIIGHWLAAGAAPTSSGGTK